MNSHTISSGLSNGVSILSGAKFTPFNKEQKQAGLFALSVHSLGVAAVLFAAVHGHNAPPDTVELPIPIQVSYVAQASPNNAPVQPRSSEQEKPQPTVAPSPSRSSKTLASERSASEVQQPVQKPSEKPATQPLSTSEPKIKPAESRASSAPNTLIASSGPSFTAAYLRNPPPVYPSYSKTNKEEGKVLLHVLVSEAGNALKVELKKSSGYGRLDQAASDVVRRWKFVPAKKNGNTVSEWVTVPIDFSLN